MSHSFAIMAWHPFLKESHGIARTKNKMRRIVLVTFLLAAVASAQQSATVGVGAVPPGRMRTTNTPTVISYDRQWIMDGFLLTDKNGEPKLHWDNGQQVAHNGMAVSWSPDSQRVVMVDHSGKAVIFYSADRENNQWYEAKVTNSDPQRPEGSRVEEVELLDWISPTEIQIKERYLLGDPPNPPQWEEHVTTLRFDGNNVLYPAN